MHDSLSTSSDVPLNEYERLALNVAAEAFVRIRLLASGPMSKERLVAIYDLADAMHNIPEQAAGFAPERLMHKFLFDSGLKRAAMAFNKHGIPTEYREALQEATGIEISNSVVAAPLETERSTPKSTGRGAWLVSIAKKHAVPIGVVAVLALCGLGLHAYRTDGTINVARDAVPVPSVGPSAELLDAVALYSVVREVEQRAAVRVTGVREVADGLARADFSDGYAMVRYRFETFGEGGCIKDETPDECTKRLTNNPFGFSVLSYELHRGGK